MNFHLNRLIFLHIPKAAGTTLEQIIRRQYSCDEIYDVTSTSSGQEQLRRLTYEERQSIKCVVGHSPFGLHEELPGRSTYITMLRDPVARVISTYYYVKRTPQHRHHDYLTRRDLSLHDFVSSGINKLLENGMSRMLSGVGTTGSVSENILDQAKKNLRQHFGIVGLVERFDQSLLLMKNRFDWSQVGYTPRNVSTQRPTKNDIDEGTLLQIRSRNQADIELYRYAESMLEEDLMGVNIDNKLKWLRLRCNFRSSFMNLQKTATRVANNLITGIK